MKRILIIAFGLMTLATLMPQSVESQERRRPAPEARQQMERQFRERFEGMVKERLALTDDQMATMRAVMEEIEPERRALGARERAAQREMSGGVPSAERADALLEEILTIRQEETRLVLLETERLREFLSSQQVLQLLRVREEWGQRIRELRSRRNGGNGAGR